MGHSKWGVTGTSSLRGGIGSENGGELVALANAMVGMASSEGASEAAGARARPAETDLGCVLSQHTLAVGGGEAT